MEEKITLCGDNCLACPRYTAKTDDELRKVAELWFKTGLRDSVVTNEEIKCMGCSSHKECTYKLVECTKAHDVEKCNQCLDFPCDKIKSMLERTQIFQAHCKKICYKEEYTALEEAFFNKEENLMK